MGRTRTRALTRAATAGAAAALAMLAGGTGAAVAGGSPGETVATGLKNPRYLSFNTTGDLFIAEAGRGGSGPCVDSPEGYVCLGATGSVTRVEAQSGRQARVVTGLPSVAAADGSSAQGPTDIVVTGSRDYVISMGLGNSPAARSALGPRAAQLGTLVQGQFGGKREVLADIAGAEGERDWDGAGADSNPGGLVRYGNRYVVADAGGNAILRVITKTGAVSPITTFDTRMVPTPPFMPPGLMPMQAVPTSVVKGPDGAWYSSELTGFPFPVGKARIMRTIPGQEPRVYATGLTNVTDLAWRGSTLYAVQLADEGLLGTPEGQLPSGSLVAVSADGRHKTVADDLTAPYGVAFRGGDAYVTLCTVCAAGGSVARLDID